LFDSYLYINDVKPPTKQNHKTILGKIIMRESQLVSL
jgi:hypothetical protein